MAKLIYVVWGSGLGGLLTDPDTRAALRVAGATRLQINIGGTPELDGAMTLSTLTPPIDAVVSVWTDSDPTPVADVLVDRTDRVVGWEVVERRPIEPPPTPDGEPADAMANVAFLRRPASIDRDEWLRRWLDDHTPVAIATQATSGYIQNIVVRSVTADTEQVDAVVEELFPLAAARDLHAFYGSGGDDAELTRRMTAMLDSVVRIGAHENIDVVPTRRTVFES
ncbi:hypothetical protein ASG12_17565 [Williamsia sp. Leaf354]|jgi:hypothetical protein|uniref:EthD domain-containing protein n=1 Tax=Williamsia sp. Leaf354 TaxID=1736349 RepID=UPI0006F997A1|nr:EthD domain-containing protein [Williamsia sp. Leaf354]KQR96044.1 hypothetical protein ASG12_17565 [Williamsia sp. Leaf354]